MGGGLTPKLSCAAKNPRNPTPNIPRQLQRSLDGLYDRTTLGWAIDWDRHYPSSREGAPFWDRALAHCASASGSSNDAEAVQPKSVVRRTRRRRGKARQLVQWRRRWQVQLPHALLTELCVAV
jgi:hypothetical protein